MGQIQGSDGNPAGPAALPGEAQIPGVLQVVLAEVERPQPAQVAEGGLGQAPQVVGSQVQPAQLREASEGVLIRMRQWNWYADYLI